MKTVVRRAATASKLNPCKDRLHCSLRGQITILTTPTYDHPHSKSDPGHIIQHGHQINVDQNAGDWYPRYEWYLKRI